jgi:hypothetical protein
MNLEHVKREKHISILKFAYILFNNSTLCKDGVDLDDY